MPKSRIGRMPPWQRWTTLVVVGCCLASGLGYLVAMDFVDGSPTSLKAWWIAHGLTGLIALLVIGGAIAQHVRTAWRAARGRASGAANLIALALLVVTALALFYGLPAWRDPAHLIHSIVGVIAIIVFPAHIAWGRTRRRPTSSRPSLRDRSARTSSD